MRLLNTKTYEFEEFLPSEQQYVILSHVWEDEE